MKTMVVHVVMCAIAGVVVGVAQEVAAAPETTVFFSEGDATFSTVQGYDLVEIEGCHLVGEPGHPLLPCVAINFVIPRDKVVASVKFEAGAKQKLPGRFYVFPAQADSFGGGFVWPDPSIYGSADPFPGTVIEEGDEMVDWGWVTYQLVVWPLEYVPADRELWLYQTLEVSLELADRQGALPEVLPRSQDQHEEWAKELEQVIANPGDVWPYAPAGATITGVPRKWVLILPGYPESLENRGWYDTFLALMQWRQQKGYVTEVKYVRQISPSLDLQEIRDYLWQQHTEGARWACLVGDDTMIPWYHWPCSNPTYPFVPSDWCYCDLDGNWPQDADWAPELWVGRVPCRTAEEGESFVQKVLQYEQYNGDPAYLWRAFYETADRAQDYYHTIEDVIAHQDSAVETTCLRELPSGGAYYPKLWFPYDDDVLAELNADPGFGYVTVHCHGGASTYSCLTDGYWGDTGTTLDWIGPVDIQSLTNQGRYFFWYSISCLNAFLDWEDASLRSIAELSTCYYPERCAVAFAGNTRFGYPGSSTDLQCCAWDWLYPQGLIPNYFNHVGRVEALSKWKYQEVCPYPSDYVCHSHNLFGDPATPIWTPRAMPAGKPLAAEDAVAPLRIALMSCDPNPVRSEAAVKFSLSNPGELRVRVYDVAGRLMQVVHEGTVPAGVGTRQWDCSELPVGVYMVRLEAEGVEATKRAVVLR